MNVSELGVTSDLFKVNESTGVNSLLNTIHRAIRIIPDYPTSRVVFRDLTTLWGNMMAFRASIVAMHTLARAEELKYTKIVGIETNGWVYAAILADKLNKPFVPVRKHSNLPEEKLVMNYVAKQGTSSVEIREDGIEVGDSILLVDDLIATGGSMGAAIACVEKLGGTVTKVVALIDLASEGGKKALQSCGYNISTALTYPNN